MHSLRPRSNRSSRLFLAATLCLATAAGLSLQNIGVADAKTPTTKKKPKVAAIATLPPSPALKAGEPVPLALVDALFMDGFSKGEITAGKLPGGFPANFPVIPESTILGGIVSTYTNGIEPIVGSTTIIGAFQTSLTVQSVSAFLQKELKALGWTQPYGGPNQAGGFEGTAEQSNFLSWCSGTMNLNIQSRALNGATVVRVFANTYSNTGSNFPMPPSICGGVPTTLVNPIQSLPTLRPPTGVVMQASGSGGYGSFAVSNAFSKTTVDVGDLLNHFNAQLVAAGWKLKKSATGPIGARASYDVVLDGKTIPGSLLIISPQDGNVTLTLTRGEQNSGGGFPGPPMTVVPLFVGPPQATVAPPAAPVAPTTVPV